MSKKPLILVTNDDGIAAQGIRELVEAVKPLGRVIVVAPDRPQSSMGHAITLDQPIRVELVDLFEGVEAAYQVSGTPVDCVKIAVNKLLDERPDVCVSGINHGLNSSINVIYSGTLSAAMEAALEDIPSAGFSLDCVESHCDFRASAQAARVITEKILKYGLPTEVFLNVNIPNLKPGNIKGFKVCRQARARWEETYEERIDPRGRKYYWLTGRFVNYDKGQDTDEWALANGYISIVPITLDFTAHHAISYLLNRWEWNNNDNT